MGTVYRALDESLQRYVALKLIRRRTETGSNASETGRVTGLLHEARAQARVNHPHVVHVYFVSRDAKNPYLAMELVPGHTAAEQIDDGGFTFQEVVQIAWQIADALRATAQFDIVHGDMKPSNILISESVAKLSDFGLSQRVSVPGAKEGRLLGTPNYMSPETCRGEPATLFSDMYSFGVTLFEMTFGQLPYHFSDTTIRSRIEAHQFRAPEFPDPWPTKVPRGWKLFLQRLLEKDPSKRFSDWGAVVGELQAFQPAAPITAGRLPRAIAWALDLMILLIGMTFVGSVVGRFLESVLPSSELTSALTILSVILAPALIMWWIGRGGSSPGKSLMQLRVVDSHGLRCAPEVLAWRSVLQFLPIWMLPTATRTESFGFPDYVWKPLWVVLGLYYATDLLLALVRRDGISLHDQFCETRVVLADTRSQQ